MAGLGPFWSIVIIHPQGERRYIMWDFMEELVQVLKDLVLYVLCLAVTVVGLSLIAIAVGVVASYEATRDFFRRHAAGSWKTLAIGLAFISMTFFLLAAISVFKKEYLILGPSYFIGVVFGYGSALADTKSENLEGGARR